MSDSKSNILRDDHRYCDDPPMSRLFVIYNKINTEEDFREHFQQFGQIEDIWILKDKNTGDTKGVAYIKFSKTSEAARALEESNGKCIGNCERPIKVLVASSRQAGSKKLQENEQEKYLRLFIVVPKSATDDEIKTEFLKYGDLEHVSLIKDRISGQPKGFAYVKYLRFYHAALAYENCPARYKAVFAEPKSRSSSNQENQSSRSDEYINNVGRSSEMSNFLKMQSNAGQTTCLEVICSNRVNQDQLWRLFDIVPGLDYCQVTRECMSIDFVAYFLHRCFPGGPKNLEASVVYTNTEAALYAREKLHGLEYPPGERLIVKLTGVDAKTECSILDKKVRKDSLCSVELPPILPLAPSDAHVARRCFIVLTSTLPQTVLKNVFCTFGNLIDVYLLPNKNCGYAKYSNEDSAVKAMTTLNGAEICGVKVKVIEAQEPNEEGRKRMRWD